jgi:hypothetical protein
LRTRAGSRQAWSLRLPCCHCCRYFLSRCTWSFLLLLLASLTSDTLERLMAQALLEACRPASARFFRLSPLARLGHQAPLSSPSAFFAVSRFRLFCTIRSLIFIVCVSLCAASRCSCVHPASHFQHGISTALALFRAGSRIRSSQVERLVIAYDLTLPVRGPNWRDLELHDFAKLGSNLLGQWSYFLV